jgi:hypothetical protein
MHCNTTHGSSAGSLPGTGYKSSDKDLSGLFYSWYSKSLNQVIKYDVSIAGKVFNGYPVDIVKVMTGQNKHTMFAVKPVVPDGKMHRCHAANTQMVKGTNMDRRPIGKT